MRATNPPWERPLPHGQQPAPPQLPPPNPPSSGRPTPSRGRALPGSGQQCQPLPLQRLASPAAAAAAHHRAKAAPTRAAAAPPPAQRATPHPQSELFLSPTRPPAFTKRVGSARLPRRAHWTPTSPCIVQLEPLRCNVWARAISYGKFVERSSIQKQLRMVTSSRGFAINLILTTTLSGPR